MALHLGFSLCLRLATFFWITEAAQLALIPPLFWEYVLAKLSTKDRKAVKVYYCAECPSCNFVAKVLQVFFLLPITEVIPLTPEICSGSLGSKTGPKPGFIVVDPQGYTRQGFYGIMTICKASPFLWPVNYMFNRPFGQLVYQYLPSIKHDNNAHAYKTSSVLIKQKKKKALYASWKKFAIQLSIQLIIAWLVILAFAWNANNVGIPFGKDLADYTYEFGVFIGIDQYWGMFSPRPPDGDFWFIIQGNLTSGEEVELFRDEGLWKWEGNEMTFDPPIPFHKSFKSHRWYKYFEVYVQDNQDALRLEFGRFICREWNNRHDDEDILQTYNIWIVEHVHNLDGTYSDAEARIIYGHMCF